MRPNIPAASSSPFPMHPPLPQSFADYFAATFPTRLPHFAAAVRPEDAAVAANLFLFRFDKKLSATFVSSHIDAVARAIADASGKPLPEARRLFSAAAGEASREYFAASWHDVQRYVRANAPTLSALHLEGLRHAAELDAVSSENSPVEVDPIRLQSLLHLPRRPVLVLVYAKYCSVCSAIRPMFEAAARKLKASALLVLLNGPECPEFKDLYNVTSYPTVVRFSSGLDSATVFPNVASFSVERCIDFVTGVEEEQQEEEEEDADSDRQQQRQQQQQQQQQHIDNQPDAPPPSTNTPPTTPESPLSLDETASPRTRTSQWQSLLKRQGIDQLDQLASERTEVLHSHIDKGIQCGESSCALLPPPSARQEGAHPLCALLGGGMGAGKTTVVNLIKSTAFWEAHGTSVVVVEADAFKLVDPLFQVLQSVTPLASRIVHRDSTTAAEELFLKAVNARRDVVFDGTLSWCEYARQTVAMLRDRHYYYERGPGYVESDDGQVSETYWVRAERRERPVEPYRIELVGVTAEPEIAVMRGIVRRISTGRGVAITDQLKSHALFSQHFEDYVKLVDSVYLFDTTLKKGIDYNHGVAVELVAIRPGVLFEGQEGLGEIERARESKNAIDGLVVRNADAYERFLRKIMLNTRATSVGELFSQGGSER